MAKENMTSQKCIVRNARPEEFEEIGKLMVQVYSQLELHAINDLNITRVDVNEQNEQALKFYEHFGFKVTSRSELDGTGKPYPILHMQLQ